ncbi:MAG: ATP-binding protein [Kiritimatiellae bacterium]|nr:ATP-binding protein [Kiritimatiellia bacterium]
MEMIPRDDYLDWIDEFRDKPLVKVLTGLRRCGKSTILDLFVSRLENEGVAASRIIKINFELLENEPYLDYRNLYSHIVESRAEGYCTYVFLDEIQHVKNYEKTVDSLLARGGFDIYITGSTSELLSSELATLLTGRYVEINVLPLSFTEYAWNMPVTAENQRRLFMDYLTYGGLPGSRMFTNGSAAQREYVESVFKAILEKDVLKRGGKGRGIVERIIRYMTATVGNLTSPKRLTDRLAAEREDQKARQVAYNTVQSYMQRLTDCFFMYKVDRFDVVGGEHLKQINKYYLTDFGFSYYILHSPAVELQQLLENVVYLELKRRRFKVATGKVDDREVDFVAQGQDGIMRYVQVAVSVSAQEKLNQELAVFKSIRDNYPKYLLTMDEVFVPDHAGVRTVNVIDYLLGRVDL